MKKLDLRNNEIKFKQDTQKLYPGIMFKLFRYITFSAIVLFSALQTTAQMAMPDNICIGTVRTYSVNTLSPPVGSTYTWKIDGVTQTSTSNSLVITWTVAGTFDLTVQEHAGGCDGEIQTGQVFVQDAFNFIINNPAEVCVPATVNITTAAITAGSATGLVFTFWTNAAATVSLANPASISISGTYYIKATSSSGCYLIKPVVVKINDLPTATITGTGIVCKGDIKTLEVIFTGKKPFIFTYSNGTTSETINSIDTALYLLTVRPLVNTTYTITNVQDANCNNIGLTSSVLVTLELPLTPIKYQNISATKFWPLQLQIRNLGPNYTYEWKPPVGLSKSTIYNPIFYYDLQTQYLISIKSQNGCEVVDTLLVLVPPDQIPPLQTDLFVPKGWSPNGDGHNDKLFPLTLTIKELKYFRIYNRWGQLVFETNIIGLGWDGIYKGKPQPLDVYTWTAEAIGLDNKKITKTSKSVLIR